MWSEQQWLTFCGLIANGFDGGRLGPFDEATADSYRILLDEFDPAAVTAAVRAMVRAGRQFRPLPGEIVGELQTDPTRPTWVEAYRDLRRALSVRQNYHDPPGVKGEVCAAWLREHSHEMVAAFFEAQTYERLSQLPIDDPDYGQLEIERLRLQWESFSERAEERVAHGLPIGTGPRREQLEGPRKPDFAAVLPPAKDEGGDAA